MMNEESVVDTESIVAKETRERNLQDNLKVTPEVSVNTLVPKEETLEIPKVNPEG